MGAAQNQAHVGIICKDVASLSQKLDAFISKVSVDDDHSSLSVARGGDVEDKIQDEAITLSYTVALDHFDAFIEELRSHCDLTTQQIIMADNTVYRLELVDQIEEQRGIIASLQTKEGDSNPDMEDAQTKLTRMETDLNELDRSEEFIVILITIDAQS